MRLTTETSVIIVNFNHQEYLQNCLTSLLVHEPLEIIVVDNKSTDGSPEYIKENFPQVKIIQNPENTGYGAGNNLGVREARGKYLVILNPDTKVKQDSLESLIEPLEKNNKLVTIPKVLLYNDEKINTCGNIIHFTGMAFTRGEGDDPQNWNQPQLVNGLSGVCFAISRENYLNLGGFDENIFLYMEDSELSWRINSQGLEILFVPEAVVCHDYDFSVSPDKIYHVEKGRYIILRKYLSSKDYILLSPSLLITEVLTWGYAILNGLEGVKNKSRALNHGLKVEINKINADNGLLMKTDTEIPKLGFRFNGIFAVFRKVANLTYHSNRRLIR